MQKMVLEDKGSDGWPEMNGILFNMPNRDGQGGVTGPEK